VQPAAAWSQADGRTIVPLQFAPYGSWFVVFRHAAPAGAAGTALRNSLQLKPIYEIPGPWKVQFDPKWGGPESAEFPQLISWTDRPEDGIRFYSGTATYRKTFDLPDTVSAGGRVFLDLGDVRQLAEVRLNGKNLGVIWAFPFRVEVTGVLKPKDNQLEIDVVNFWPNRVIGDQSLPPEKRFTKTNIRKLTKDTPLVPSGLLGPVRMLRVKTD
jgi:beta-galactosidase/beta-glucuronidase